MGKQHVFGQRSLAELQTCHRDLQLIAVEALADSSIDWGVTQGRRTFDEQLQFFLNGDSRLDPRIPEHLAKCRHIPPEGGDGLSTAMDVYAAVPGRKDLAFDYNHLCHIAGVIECTAKRLYREGRITHLIRWGGNWDGDGEIITDQKFNDLVHFELVAP